MPVAAALPSSAAGQDGIAADLARYVGLGGKASGGSGDMEAADWLGRELARAGYAVERQRFDAPFFTTRAGTLAMEGHRAGVIPQAIVVPTGAGGVSGRLVRVAPGLTPGGMRGAIALVELPHGRWSSAMAKPVRETVRAAIAGGAVAAVIVTTGPTGGALALNAPGDEPLFDVPVAVLAPRDAAPFLAAAAQPTPARLVIDGEGGRRPASNLVARRDRGRGRWLIVSTPRSGWFACAGERGPGVAAWLALARWAAGSLPRHDLAFVCTSGHEYEYLGAEALMRTGTLPVPARTDLWLHLGANVAARDWQELTGTLQPLPSADSQRYLMTSATLLPLARRAFAGLPGLEAPRAAGPAAAGELATILAAGYPRVAGIFGAHRHHHSAEDDARCVDPALVAAAAAACRTFVEGALA